MPPTLEELRKRKEETQAASPNAGPTLEELKTHRDQSQAPTLDRSAAGKFGLFLTGLSPQQVEEVQNPTPEEFRRRGRLALESAAALAAAPLTGGLGSGLAAAGVRAALMGGAGAGASLLAETFDPTAAQPGSTLPEPEGIVAKVGRLLSGESGSAAAQRAAGTGLAFAATDLGASALGGLAGRLSRPIFPTAEPERVVAREQIRKAGGVIPPAQATGSSQARLLQGLAESSLGSGRLQATKRQAEKIAKDAIQDFAGRYPERFGREELGTIIQDALEGRTAAFSKAAEQAYSHVDEAFSRAIQRRLAKTGAVIRPGTQVTVQPTVSLSNVKSEAIRLLREGEQGLPERKLSGLLEQVLGKPDIVTFQGAQRLRSDLLREIRARGAEPLSGAAKGTLKRVSGLVDQAMESTAKEAGGEVLQAWRSANEGYRKGIELFNSKLIRAVSNAQPATVVDAIVKANRPDSIRLARQAVGNARAWSGVQRSYLERLLTRDSINRATEDLSGQRILTNIAKFGDSAGELLGADRLKELERFARTLKIVQEQTGKGAGGIGIRSAPDLIGLSLVLSGRVGKGLTFGLAPAAVSRLFSNPTAVRWLTEGIRAPVGSSQAARAFLQISQILARNQAEDRSPVPSGLARSAP